MSKKIIFKGSGVALVTPMMPDGIINYDKLNELIDFHLNSKTDAIIVSGTTGESATLTKDEQIYLMNYIIEKVNNKIPVIVGTGSNCTSNTLWMSNQAKNAGADALLIVTPYYNKTSQSGLVKHYFTIAESVDIPIILYNVPSRTGLNILPETYLELSKHPNIVATKEANGDISSIIKTISLCEDNLKIYSGNDDQIFPVISLGGIGIISVLANIMPIQIHNICQLFFDGQINESRKIQLDLIPIIESMFKTVNPIPIKQAMNLIGWNVGNCRLPLFSNDESLVLSLKENLINYGLIEK